MFLFFSCFVFDSVKKKKKQYIKVDKLQKKGTKQLLLPKPLFFSRAKKLFVFAPQCIPHRFPNNEKRIPKFGLPIKENQVLKGKKN